MKSAAALAAGALVALACDSGGTSVPIVVDSGGLVLPQVLLRGEYLVRNVAGCGECHTPRAADGTLDQSQWLAGVTNRFDLTPSDDTTGGLSAPNLTPASLATASDAAIEDAFLNGVGLDGSPLFPLMPYAAYHNMTAADADAIVTYLRAVPAITNATPPRQPLPVPFTQAAPPIPESAIPQTTLLSSDSRYASAERGRYLAGEVGFCLDCHTDWRLGQPQPLDLTRVFAGGRSFSSRDWVVPPPAPAVVYSYDITPDPTGIGTWSAADVAEVLMNGTAPGGSALCRPMPFGPTGSLGGLSTSDAMDIGQYLMTIAPIASDGIPTCPVGAE